MGEHVTSHEHRDKAMEAFQKGHVADAQFHATMAVYEGLFELVGDGSMIDNSLRHG